MRERGAVWAGLLAATALCGCGKPGAGPPPAASAASPVAAAAPNPQSPALAPEIVAFRIQRDACDHFRGEEPYDAKRAAFLASEVAKNCTGTDRALADLRRRYGGDAAALNALKDYEDKIE